MPSIVVCNITKQSIHKFQYLTNTSGNIVGIIVTVLELWFIENCTGYIWASEQKNRISTI